MRSIAFVLLISSISAVFAQPSRKMDCVGQGICCRHAEALSSGSWHNVDHSGLDWSGQTTGVFHYHRPHKPYRPDKDNLRQQQFEDKSHDSAND